MKSKLMAIAYKVALRRGTVSDREAGKFAPFAFDVKVGLLRVWDYGWDSALTITRRGRTILAVGL